MVGQEADLPVSCGCPQIIVFLNQFFSVLGIVCFDAVCVRVSPVYFLDEFRVFDVVAEFIFSHPCSQLFLLSLPILPLFLLPVRSFSGFHPPSD